MLRRGLTFYFHKKLGPNDGKTLLIGSCMCRTKVYFRPCTAADSQSATCEKGCAQHKGRSPSATCAQGVCPALRQSLSATCVQGCAHSRGTSPSAMCGGMCPALRHSPSATCAQGVSDTKTGVQAPRVRRGCESTDAIAQCRSVPRVCRGVPTTEAQAQAPRVRWDVPSTEA
jgi:hypothetical protein